jgi:hypothetical protein
MNKAGEHRNRKQICRLKRQTRKTQTVAVNDKENNHADAETETEL